MKHPGKQTRPEHYPERLDWRCCNDPVQWANQFPSRSARTPQPEPNPRPIPGTGPPKTPQQTLNRSPRIADKDPGRNICRPALSETHTTTPQPPRQKHCKIRKKDALVQGRPRATVRAGGIKKPHPLAPAKRRLDALFSAGKFCQCAHRANGFGCISCCIGQCILRSTGPLRHVASETDRLAHTAG